MSITTYANHEKNYLIPHFHHLPQQETTTSIVSVQTLFGLKKKKTCMSSIYESNQ